MSERFSALLDTHVLLWWLNGDPRINAEREQQLSLLPCLVSAVSIWEVAINIGAASCRCRQKPFWNV